MMRSLFAAISALRNHQTYMDVIGNNLANVNTVGYKSSRVSFSTLLVQTLRGAQAGTDARAAIDPVQVGLGTTLGSIAPDQEQGAFQVTGARTDLGIEGNGLFVLSDEAGGTFYSRDGGLSVASDGSLIHSATGMRIQGWNVDALGEPIDTGAATVPITIPLNQTVAATPTTTATINGNLDANAAVLDQVQVTVPVIDSLGVTHSISVTLEKQAAPPDNTWNVTAAASATDTAVSTVTVTSASNQISFKPEDGTVDTGLGSGGVLSIEITLTNGAASPQEITNLDLTGTTQQANTSSLSVTSQDGAPAGVLVGFTIGSDGLVVGAFSNGATRALAQLVTASFPNPAGMVQIGNNLLASSAASGLQDVGRPTSGPRGALQSGVLEMSNVNLSQEFTNMIVAQRGFQANARVITASDELLQDLINMRR